MCLEPTPTGQLSMGAGSPTFHHNVIALTGERRMLELSNVESQIQNSDLTPLPPALHRRAEYKLGNGPEMAT
jgi:hypothetical protein